MKATPRTVLLASVWAAFLVAVCLCPAAAAVEVGTGGVYSVVEITFHGPRVGSAGAPARDVAFWVRVRHESGAPEYKVHGFYDGDGNGGAAGNVFKVRFCPTKAGRWNLAEVHSSSPCGRRSTTT